MTTDSCRLLATRRRIVTMPRAQRNHTVRAGALTALMAGLLAACTVGPGGTTSPGATANGNGELFSTQPPAGGGGPGGAVIAELETIAPGTQHMVLRGTFPVPKGTYPRTDGLEPFSIRDWDGNTVPTQVEIVTRYPDDLDGADVIEVIGRVSMPPGAVPQERLVYQVVENPHAKSKLPAKGPVVKLLTKPDNALLKAWDCFGNEYSIDVFESVRAVASGESSKGRLLRSGQGAVTIGNYGVMMPQTTNIGPPNGALPHFFGVHSYTTAWAWTDTVSLDLRVNNAASGLDKSSEEDDPLGKAYFRAIELWVPKGWMVVPDINDPFFGSSRDEGQWTAFELVRPLSGGEMHVMPAQSSFHRRLALTNEGNGEAAAQIVNEGWLGFARRGTAPSGGELYSWWNHSTHGYFPQKHRLAELDYLGKNQIEGKLNAMENTSRKVLTTGQGLGAYPYEENVMGWAHPWGVRYGGMTGGGEVFLYDGFLVAEAASQDGYKHLENTHRMYTSRQADKLYDADGRPTRVENWAISGSEGQYVNMQMFQKLLNGSPDPFGMNTSPGYQRNYVMGNGLTPAYEENLYSYDPIDFQHYVRYTRSPKVLMWLGNDQLAKDDVMAAAEVFRMSYHPYAVSANGSVLTTTLLDDELFVNKHPGIGYNFGRGEAWGTDSVLSAYASADPDWRASVRPWFDKNADTIVAGQSSCNGVIQAFVNQKWVGGLYRARQSIEQAITEHMLYGMIETVYRDVDNGRTASLEYVLGKSTEAMIGPICWNSSGNAPHSAAAVAPIDMTQPPYCSSLPPSGYGNGIDKFQIWSSFAYGMEKTGNQEFMNKALACAGGGNLWSQMVGMGFNNLENRMALLADMQ